MTILKRTLSLTASKGLALVTESGLYASVNLTVLSY